MSSGWLAHSVFHGVFPNNGSAKNADIDYVKDDRFYVRAVTKGLEILGWE